MKTRGYWQEKKTRQTFKGKKRDDDDTAGLAPQAGAGERVKKGRRALNKSIKLSCRLRRHHLRHPHCPRHSHSRSCSFSPAYSRHRHCRQLSSFVQSQERRTVSRSKRGGSRSHPPRVLLLQARSHLSPWRRLRRRSKIDRRAREVVSWRGCVEIRAGRAFDSWK